MRRITHKSGGQNRTAVLSGHDFSHAEKSPKKSWALAPPGRFSQTALRCLILPLIIVLGVFTMGAADTAGRYSDLGHKIMCTCGCNEILLECNHMGCQASAKMTVELRAAVDRGDSDNAVLTAFQDEYGPTALAAPWLTKFNIVAWVVPPLLLILGLAGTFLLVKKWRLRVATTPEVADDPASRDLRDRIRRETEI
ncbi:MAG TPA: cytochrome c-type biogenesis protein CcmH [Acidobacteriaceae bacterium]|jgi:cytochrome c-type biogenesis protein CcmH|nr:cytochrome c-type biogenesis protein CcmH [Acidobacteriaceae bacterium]